MYLLSNMAILDIYVRFQGVEKSWLFSWDPFHYHLLFQSSAIWVSHPHEILRLKVPAVVAVPVLKNSSKGNGYVEMRKLSTNSTSFSTFHMTSKGRNFPQIQQKMAIRRTGSDFDENCFNYTPEN